MTEQRQNTIADQVGGGEIAGYQQQVASNDNLALGKPTSRFLGGDERTDEVSAALTVPCLRRARKIITEALPRCRQLRRLLGRPSWVEDLRSSIRPALELCQVAGIDAQHLGDHDDGQRDR